MNELKLNLKDSKGNDLNWGDCVLFKNAFDSGEYGQYSDDVIGIIKLKEGHTYFRYLFDNMIGYEDETFGNGYDWDCSECIKLEPSEVKKEHYLELIDVWMKE